MALDTSALEKALASLDRGLQRATAAVGDEELRDAVIQRFEYSVDLCWKLLQRALKDSISEARRVRTKRDLFREGARLGYLEDPVRWFEYQEARNETSHTYNADAAQRVFACARRFYPDALALLHELKRER